MSSFGSGIGLPREHTIADQTSALVLTLDNEHLANPVGARDRYATAALVVNGHRL
jgi:hypothetical protein